MRKTFEISKVVFISASVALLLTCILLVAEHGRYINAKREIATMSETMLAKEAESRMLLTMAKDPAYCSTIIYWYDANLGTNIAHGKTPEELAELYETDHEAWFNGLVAFGESISQSEIKLTTQ